MQKIRELKEIAGTYSLLYVEDEESIRKQGVELFSKFFGTVYEAEDGEKGLEQFRKYSPDIVVTDIRMPKLDGLKMAEQIKAISENTPVIVTTAYTDTEYFMESIKLGISRYITKPIDDMQFYQVLYDVVLMLEDRKKALAYEKKITQERVNTHAQHLLTELVNFSPTPTIVYRGNELVFANNALIDMLDQDVYRKILESNEPLDSILIQKPEYMRSFADLDLNNKAFVKTKEGASVYLVDRNDVMVGGETEPTQIYVLTDISTMERRRIKNHAYSNYLQNLLRHRQAEDDLSSPFEMDEEERERLSVLAAEKMDAKTYEKTLVHQQMHNIEVLKQTGSEIKELLSVFEKRHTQETLEKIANLLEEYSQNLKALNDFEELAFAVSKVSGELLWLDIEKVHGGYLYHYLLELMNDLIHWYRRVFETQDATDVHFLDSSVLGTCLQIDVIFGPHKNDLILEDPGVELF